MKEVFYGDIFVINGKGCLLFGSGKTKAGREASLDDEKNEIALDFACIERVGQTVYGSFDLPSSFPRIGMNPNPNTTRVELTVFIRFLNQDETNHYYKNGILQIREISYDDFINLSEFNICFNLGNIGLEIFRELTHNSNVDKFLIVPWMDSHQTKGDMLRNYIQP